MKHGTRLRVLDEIAARGSLSAAADALGMSQSAVSQHLAALESALNVRLVERGTRPVQLTEAGAALVRHVRVVVARLDTADQEIAEITRRRHARVRLGSFPTALATFVPGVLARFQRREPGATLTVIDDHLQRLLPRLHDGELDVALVYDDQALPIEADPELNLVHLFDDSYRIVLSQGHRLARSGRPVALIELRAEKWVGGSASSAWFRIVSRACHEVGFDPRVVLVSDDYIAVQAFVAAGLGVAVVPGLAAVNAPRGVEVRQIQAAAPVRRIWAAQVRDAYPSPATRTMIELLTSSTAGAGSNPESRRTGSSAPTHGSTRGNTSPASSST